MVKSRISKYEKISSVTLFNEVEDYNKLLEEVEVRDELLGKLLIYDKEGFEKLIEDYKWLNNEYITISGYMQFQEYEKAKTKLDLMIKRNEKENNQEKVVWTYYILSEVQRLERNQNFDFKAKIVNLEKEYQKRFKRETKLYNEIFDLRTLKKLNKKMSECLSEARKGRRSIVLMGETPIEKAQNLFKDIYNFCILNGISLENKIVIETITAYVELLFIAYKNNEIETGVAFGKILKVNIFNYLDCYCMIHLANGRLNELFEEYNLKYMKSASDVASSLIIMFKAFVERNKSNRINFKHQLENIILVFSRIKLNEEQVSCIIEVISKSNMFFIFYKDNGYFRNLQEYFITFLYYHLEEMNKNIFEDMILKIVSSREELNERVIGALTYDYEKLGLDKLKTTSKLLETINKNNSMIKIYLLQILKKEDRNNFIKELVEQLKKNFDLKIYYHLLLIEDIIEEQLEREIIPALNKDMESGVLEKKSFDYVSSLLAQNKISEKVRKDLREYNNPQFIEYLEKTNQRNMWEYFLSPEEFDYSKLEICEIRDFTDPLIKEIIEEGYKNKIFREKLRNYVESHNGNNNIVKNFLKFSFENLRNDIS